MKFCKKHAMFLTEVAEFPQQTTGWKPEKPPLSAHKHSVEEFLERSRVASTVYILRGLYLPKKFFLKPLRDFVCLDWIFSICILGVLLAKAGSHVRILLDLEAVLGYLVKDGDLFRRLYLVFAHCSVPVLMTGNMISVLETRKVFQAWRKIEEPFDLTSAFGQKIRFHLAEGLQMLSLFLFVLYRTQTERYPQHRELDTIASMAYFEMTYHTDMTMLTLLHIAHKFDSLAKVTKDCLVQLKSGQGGGPHCIMIRKSMAYWVHMKGIVDDVGRAASYYWIPFLLWALMSISLKIYSITSKPLPKDIFPTLYAFFTILCRSVLIALICEVGHTVKASAREFTRVLAEFPHPEDSRAAQVGIFQEVQIFLGTAEVHDGVSVNFADFCTMDRSVIPAALTTVVTYFIAFVQLKGT